MSNLVHKSGAYSDVEIPERGELALPGGREGEIAAYGRPVGTEERIAAYLLTEYLERIGVEVIFGLCGHTVVALLDALGKSKIRYVSARHEQVAAHMAEGYARATGKPGVLMTHLGPGLTNAVTGIANAALDSIPMVVIAGDVPSYYYGRHPHQEVNMFLDGGQFEICRPFCKRVYRVDRVDDLPRCIERAFHLAMSGRPGPVLVDVPMDHFSANLFIDAFSKEPPFVARPCIEPAIAQRMVETLAEAERPVLYAGGGVTSMAAGAAELLTQLAELLDIPVAHTLMGKGCMPDGHPLLAGQTGFWGTPVANALCREADYILAIGTRLAEANSSSWDPRYTFNIPPTKLMHIDIDPMEIGRNYPTFIGAISDSKLALQELVAAAREIKPRRDHNVRARIAESQSKFKSNFTEHYTSNAFPLRPERILSDLREALPEDGYVVTDVGWNKNGVAQQFPFKHAGSFITPSGLATMGFGAAAVLGVKLAQPERAAVALIGDGGFCAANPSVIATAMEADIPVVWIVMDNSAFGVIAGLEQAKYNSTFGCVFLRDGRPYHIDYAAIAKAHGAVGVDIKHPDELKPAIEAALQSKLPTLIRIPMVNVPTPTPGHWNINDIYRCGD